MALSDDWDPAELDRAVAADSKRLGSRVLGVPTPQDLAESALERSGHSLRGRDLRVLPGGVVIASPRPKESRNPSIPPRATPVGQPRPAPGGRSTGDVLRIVASAPAAVGNTVTNAATGGSGDTALGRLMGAVIAGVLVLELGSMFAKKYWSLSIGGGSAMTSTAAANAAPNASGAVSVPSAGRLTPAELAQILGYNP